MPTLVKANGQNVDQRGTDDGAAFTIPTVDVHTGTTATRTGLSLASTDYGYYFWDTDLSAMYMWYGASWDLAPKYVAGAALVTGPDGTSVLGGIKTYEVAHPARDVFGDWFFGNDTTYETLTVNTENVGSPVEVSELHPDARTIVILTEGDAPDYTYTVFASRSGQDADKALVIAATNVPSAAAGVVGTGSRQKRIPLNGATYGYDQFLHINIKPTTGDTTTKLNYKVYVTGRGG